MTIGERIKNIRKANGLTQKALAEKSGISEVSIKQYESEKRKPKIEQVQKIASAFNVSPDFLLGTSDNPTPPNKKSDWVPYEKMSKSFYEGYDNLSEESRKVIEAYMNFLLEQEKNKNNPK